MDYIYTVFSKDILWTQTHTFLISVFCRKSFPYTWLLLGQLEVHHLAHLGD